MSNNYKLNKIGSVIVDSAIAVHRELGPGLLESAYQLALKMRIGIKRLECGSKCSSESSL